MARSLLSAATTLFLLSLTLSPPSATASDAVLDIDGDPLVPGSYYYVVPLIIQNGGGLTTLSEGPPACPRLDSFKVSQLSNPFEKGIPLLFSPKDPEQKQISVSSDVNIAFKYLKPQPLCRLLYSRVWSLLPDSATGNIYVGLWGELGEGSWFKIEKVEYGGYNIVYRPSDATSGDIVSGTVGVLSDENGERVLGIDSANPLWVIFIKA